jgi:hypothetical protein
MSAFPTMTELARGVLQCVHPYEKGAPALPTEEVLLNCSECGRIDPKRADEEYVQTLEALKAEGYVKTNAAGDWLRTKLGEEANLAQDDPPVPSDPGAVFLQLEPAVANISGMLQ